MSCCRARAAGKRRREADAVRPRGQGASLSARVTRRMSWRQGEHPGLRHRRAAHDAVHGEDEPGRGVPRARRPTAQGPALLRAVAELGPEPADAPDAHGRPSPAQRTDRRRRPSATVGGNGAVTGITITNPGSGYTPAHGRDHQRRRHGRHGRRRRHRQQRRHRRHRGRARRRLQEPAVTITGGGATTAATATAYGGVDAVTLANAGTGYTVPDGRLRHAGRSRTASRPRRTPTMDAARRRSRRSSWTTPAPATRPPRTSSSATARSWTRSQRRRWALRPRATIKVLSVVARHLRRRLHVRSRR